MNLPKFRTSTARRASWSDLMWEKTTFFLANHHSMKQKSFHNWLCFPFLDRSCFFKKWQNWNIVSKPLYFMWSGSTKHWSDAFRGFHFLTQHSAVLSLSRLFMSHVLRLRAVRARYRFSCASRRRLVSSCDEVMHSDQRGLVAQMWRTTVDHPAAAASVFHYGGETKRAPEKMCESFFFFPFAFFCNLLEHTIE